MCLLLVEVFNNDRCTVSCKNSYRYRSVHVLGMSNHIWFWLEYEKAHLDTSLPQFENYWFWDCVSSSCKYTGNIFPSNFQSFHKNEDDITIWSAPHTTNQTLDTLRQFTLHMGWTDTRNEIKQFCQKSERLRFNKHSNFFLYSKI